jgi:hypothetical protein
MTDADITATRRQIEEWLRRVASPEYKQRELQKKLGQFDQRDQERVREQVERDEEWRRQAPEREARKREEARRQQEEEERRKAAETLRALQERQRIKELVDTSWVSRIEQFQGLGPKYVGPCQWGHCNPIQLVQLARSNLPTTVGHNVTDFSHWVFKLEHGNGTSLEGMILGKLLEREIVEQQRERDLRRRDLNFVRGAVPARPDWRVVYEDDLTPTAKTFRVNALRVNGTSLIAKPDLVLEDRHGCIYIVDRKASNIAPPTFSWHNVRAQLWAYSLIDDWKDRPIRLCVEVWRHDTLGYPESCQVISWAKHDKGAEQAILRLFEIYGGTLLGS